MKIGDMLILFILKLRIKVKSILNRLIREKIWGSIIWKILNFKAIFDLDLN